MSDLFTAIIAAGGNSHAARSARAKLQWRDRFGKFIEMGKGIKFKFRRPDGSVVSAKGTFVGVTNDPNKGQVYVKGDANGLKDGFYDISSANAQEILGSLDPTYLQQQGVRLGQHQDGTSVGDRLDEDIPAQAEIPYYDAPTGWRKEGAGYVTDDGEFRIMPTSFPVRQKTGNQFTLFQNGKSTGAFKDWAPALVRVDELDAATPFDNNAARAENQANEQARIGNANDKAAQLAPEAGDAKTRALAAVKDYDPEGTIAGLIDSNSSSKDILDALSLNPTWKAKMEDYETRNGVDAPTAEQKASWSATEAEMKAIQSLDSEQSIATVDTETGHNLDLSVGDVSADGYLVPTDGNLEVIPAAEFSADRMAEYVNRKKDQLAGGGKRLSVTTDDEGNVTFDIVDQVAEHNEAQQLASERGSTEIFDVANGKTITTSQGRPRNDGENTNPDPSAEQPVGTGDLPASNVADAPSGGDSVEAPRQEPDAGAQPAGGDTDLGGTPSADSSPRNDTNTDPGTEPASPIDNAGPSTDNNTPAGTGDGAQGDTAEPDQNNNEAAGLAPVPQAQAPVVDPADNLPADRDALSRMAQRLEARAAARQDGPAADVIAAQLDAVYAKIDRLDAGESEPRALAPDSVTSTPLPSDSITSEPIAPNSVTPEPTPGTTRQTEEALDQARASEASRTPINNDGQIGTRSETPAEATARQDRARDDIARLEAELDAALEDGRNAGRAGGAVERQKARKAADERKREAMKAFREAIDARTPETFAAGDRVRWRDWQGNPRAGEVVGDGARPGVYAVRKDGAARAEADLGAQDGRALFRDNAVEPAPTPAPVEEPRPTPEAPAPAEPVVENAPETPEADPAEEELNDIQRQINEMQARMVELEAERDAARKELEDLQKPADEPAAAEPVDAPEAAELPAEPITEPESSDPASMDYVPVDEPAPADIPPVVNVFERQDGGSNFRDADGLLLGSIEIADDGTYSARSETGLGAFTRFTSRESAAQWMGERIAFNSDSNINPVTGQNIFDEPAQPENPVYFATDAREASPARSVMLKNVLEGKDLSPNEKAEILSRIERIDLVRGEASDIASEISFLPDAPVSRSKPRDPETNPANFTQANPALEQVDPGRIVDPNLILQDLKRNHDGYRTLANGDVIIESRNVGNKTYDLIVRRTGAERFFPYVRETNTDTGVARAFKVGDDTHSYKALRTKLNTGKNFLRAKDVDKRFQAKRKGVETLQDGAAFNEVPDPIRDFIEHTDLARSGDEHTDKMAALVSNLIVRGEERAVLDEVALREDLSPEFIDRVAAAVTRKAINDRMRSKAQREAVIKKSHIPYGGGEALKEGDWVDWTDYRPNINVGKENEEPNPNYGRVYRGEVRKLRYKTNDGNGQYVYSDSTYVVFDGLNREAGLRPSLQRQRISSQLKKVDSEFAPASAPFFAKKDEKAAPSENIARTFNVPANPLRGETLPVEKPARPVDVPVVAETDINGVNFLGADENPVAIPDNNLEMLMDWLDGETVEVSYGEIRPADYLTVHRDGGPRNAIVLSVENVEGGVDLEAAYYDSDDNLQKTVVALRGGSKLSVSRKPDLAAVQFEGTIVPDAGGVDNPVAQARVRAVGERVYVDDIPGRYGVVSDVSAPNTQGERTYTIVGDEDKLEYPRQERYISDEANTADLDNATIRPANMEPDFGWKGRPATIKQIDFIKSLAKKKKLSPASQKQINKALADPELTQGQASQFIDELKLYQDKKRSVNDADGIAGVAQGVANRLKADPDAAVSGQAVQDAVNAAKQERAQADAAELDRTYGGYAVKAIGYSDVVSVGPKAPFNERKGVFPENLRVGDIYETGLGNDTRRYQVLQILPAGRFKTRMMASPNGAYDIYDGDVQNQTLNRYKRLASVYSPTDNAPTGYFRPEADPVEAPGAPKEQGSYSTRAQAILSRVAGGYRKVKKIAEGAINQGAWYIKPKDEKDELFMKLVSPGDGNREFHNEIIASKIFNAFGLNDVVVTGLDDKRTIIQTKVSGNMAFVKSDDANDIEMHPSLYPNARIIGLVDYLLVNSDRHRGNWFIDEMGQPVPIDHGYTFFDNWHDVNSPFAGKALGRLWAGRDGDPAFSLAELEGYYAALVNLKGDFTANGNKHGAEWYEFVTNRLAELIDRY